MPCSSKRERERRHAEGQGLSGCGAQRWSRSGSSCAADTSEAAEEEAGALAFAALGAFRAAPHRTTYQ